MYVYKKRRNLVILHIFAHLQTVFVVLSLYSQIEIWAISLVNRYSLRKKQFQKGAELSLN